MTPYVLTADIGTSSLKCACVDFDGCLLSFARTAFNRSRTVSAEDWECALTGAIRELIRKQGNLKPEALCISGNGPTLVPVSFEGGDFSPLHWHDEKTIRLSGGFRSFFLPRAAWFKENDSSAYEKTEYFFSSHEWLMHRLGAERVTSLPSPAYEPYYWDEVQCGVFGIEKNKFPPFVKMGTVVGNLSSDAAERLGLVSGIPLVSGAPDFISAIIGSGALKPGTVCDRAGSSEGINLCIPESEGIDSEAEVRILPHAVDGLWNLSAVLPQSGLLFEQFRELCGEASRDYEELLAELIPFNGDGSFRNKDWPQVPKVFVSQKNGVAEFSEYARNFLSLHTSEKKVTEKIERGRFTLEAIGFSVRRALEKLTTYGFPVNEMIVSGGQGKNARWNRLKAGMTGTGLLIPEIIDAELAGNAVLAALALGEVSGLEDGAARMIRIKEKFLPGEENALFWKERYASFNGV